MKRAGGCIVTFREKGLLAVLVGLLLLGVAYLYAGSPRSSVAPPARMASTSAHRAASIPFPLPATMPFAKDIKTFVASVREAEKQSDPLQRCLAYPDPPGSHWKRDAVVAYCQYRFQPTITYAEVKDLIQHGNTAELDRRMDQALQAQLTQPDARGRLDHIFVNDFEDGSFATRELLDAWKRGSRNSAYAYAASGYAYVEMAQIQRGEQFARDTPQEKLDAMGRLLRQADADLQHAMRLNPRITPVYVAMIYAGGLGFGADYANQAIERGLKVDPSNWSIYSQMMWLAQPEWFGSLSTMQHVADSAMRHADLNPLLWMEKLAVERYQANANGCGCAPPPRALNFPAAFDELAVSGEIGAAGDMAAKQGVAPVAVVYLSEAMRFQPQMEELRRKRAEQLALVGESEMALDEANKLIAAAPENELNYKARGNVYLFMGDSHRGMQDLETALSMNPDDDDVMAMLGNIYSNYTHEWDKAWDIADRIIRKYPNSSDAWVMRATIQESQPRLGLEDTYQYFLTHFANDPTMKWQIDHMREVLAKTSQAGTAVPPETH